MVGWCLRILRDEEEAADIAQDVFLRVNREISSFRGDSRFTTWLYVIARRVALDRIRRSSSRRDKLTLIRNEETPTEPSLLDVVDRSESARELRDVVNRILVPDEAKVIYMHYSLGMTLPSITAMLALTNKSGAKAYMVSAMRKLRRHYRATPERQATSLR